MECVTKRLACVSVCTDRERERQTGGWIDDDMYFASSLFFSLSIHIFNRKKERTSERKRTLEHVVRSMYCVSIHAALSPDLSALARSFHRERRSGCDDDDS